MNNTQPMDQISNMELAEFHPAHFFSLLTGVLELPKRLDLHGFAYNPKAHMKECAALARKLFAVPYISEKNLETFLPDISNYLPHLQFSESNAHKAEQAGAFSGLCEDLRIFSNMNAKGCTFANIQMVYDMICRSHGICKVRSFDFVQGENVKALMQKAYDKVHHHCA